MASPLAQALALQNAVNPGQASIHPTDVLGAYKLSSDVAEKNYQAKLQQMQAMWGGLASLGAAGILGFGKPWAEGKYGAKAAANAASSGNSAAPAVTSGIDPATGGPVAASSTSMPESALIPDAGTTGLIPDATAPLASDFSIGSVAPSVAPSIAADYGLGGAGAGAGGLLGGDAAGAAGSIAADMGAAGAADALAGGAGEAAAASIPEWLAGLLAFL